MRHRVVRKYEDGHVDVIAESDDFKTPGNKRAVAWAHRVVAPLPLSSEWEYNLQYFYISWRDLN